MANDQTRTPSEENVMISSFRKKKKNLGLTQIQISFQNAKEIFSLNCENQSICDLSTFGITAFEIEKFFEH